MSTAPEQPLAQRTRACFEKDVVGAQPLARSTPANKERRCQQGAALVTKHTHNDSYDDDYDIPLPPKASR